MRPLSNSHKAVDLVPELYCTLAVMELAPAATCHNWQFGGLRAERRPQRQHCSCRQAGLPRLKSSTTAAAKTRADAAAELCASTGRIAQAVSGQPQMERLTPGRAAATLAVDHSPQPAEAPNGATDECGRLLLKSFTWPQLQAWCAAQGELQQARCPCMRLALTMHLGLLCLGRPRL